MKVLWSWLEEFTPLPGDPASVGDTLSDLGLAVESTEVVGAGLDDVVVARVLGLRPHPDADRIQLVDVDAGDAAALQVCCGAFNMAVGDLVPLAPVGAVLPGDFEIGRRKMRGQWSEGMLCAAEELGLHSDDDGIMILDADLRPGQRLVEALGITADVVFELEVNPNRPDALSVTGVARDLAARHHAPFSLPEPDVPTSGEAAHDRVRVEVVDADLCGRFLAIVLDGVTVGPSPAWMADRLVAVGMRPVNNIVDISNYVMWELGAPNHAYDLALLRGGSGGDSPAGEAVLRARWARAGEEITTLDGVPRTLSEGDGVIADATDRPVGIAGVMGGASTEISDATTSVVVEFAWWDPMTIARSSRRLGLRSEASARFERGCDPAVIPLAARRFAELAVATGASLAPGVLDVTGDAPKPPTVTVRAARVNRLLGTELTPAEIAAEIEPIGFVCSPASDETLEVTVPSWRPDTSTETDVVEEVARMIGYANLPVRRPARATTGGLDERQRLRRQLRQILVGLGASEAMPTPLLSVDDLAAAGLATEAVRITNPLAAEESLLRTSLGPGLLKAVAHNVAHRNATVRLFEVGRVFLPPDDGAVLPTEPEHLALILSGEEAPSAVSALDVIADRLAFRPELMATPAAGMHPTRTATLRWGDRTVGLVGEISPEVVDALGLSGPVAWLELDVDALLAVGLPERTYRPVSRFPSSDIDLAFVVPNGVPAAEVRRAIAETGGDLVVGIELFDVYRGDGVPSDTRSLAHRLRLQAPDRTLTDAEVGEVRQRVVDGVTARLGAALR